MSSLRTGIIKALVIVFLCIGIFGSAGYFAYKMFVAPQKVLKKEQAGPQPTPPPDPSIAEFARCMKLKESGDLLGARAALEDFVAHQADSPKVDDARTALGEVNMKLLFSTQPDPEKEQYVIQKGDTINAIERKTKVPADLLMRLNNIEDPTKLRIGQTLNITKPEFALKIYRKTQNVVLLNKGKFFKQYKVQTWNIVASKNPAAYTGKVTEKSAWKNNQRVAFGSKDYVGSGRWIATSATAYTLYSDGVDGVPKPQSGLGMSQDDMDELSTLINRGAPVSIE